MFRALAFSAQVSTNPTLSFEVYTIYDPKIRKLNNAIEFEHLLVKELSVHHL